MKKTFVLMAIIAMTLSAMPMAIAAGPAEITSPSAGEVIYQNTLNLEASDPNVALAGTGVHWAVVTDQPGGIECTGNIHFNKNNHAYTWEVGEFSAQVDVSGLAAGEYCFVFNTVLENADHGVRLVQWFYIVDDYAEIDGTIGVGQAGRGNSPTHAFKGAIGSAGAAGIVGEFSVNYRMLDETCVFTPQQTVKIGEAAPGIGVTEPVRANGTFDNSCGGTAAVWLLGTGSGLEAYPRGALVIWASKNEYTIDLNPAIDKPADNWYPVERGNIVVGKR